MDNSNGDQARHLCPGWEQARGCRVEYLAASEHDLKVICGKGVIL